MVEINNSEALMVWIMNRFSEVFPQQAILKGGMVLRLLDCQRSTNDLDYVFIAFKSKKDLVPMITAILQELDGAEIEHSLHSTSLRFRIRYKGFGTQIEANVQDKCKTQTLSTTTLAKPNNQTSRFIKIMSFDWALAHKLAAWNERSLMRDLYDIYFLHSVLDELPDIDVLKKRLNKINYSGVQRALNGPKSMSLKGFLKKLDAAVSALSADNVNEELRDYFNADELAGLDKKMKIGIRQLIDRLGER